VLYVTNSAKTHVYTVSFGYNYDSTSIRCRSSVIRPQTTSGIFRGRGLVRGPPLAGPPWFF